VHFSSPIASGLNRQAKVKLLFFWKAVINSLIMCDYMNLDAGYSAVRRPVEILVENPEFHPSQQRCCGERASIQNPEFGEAKL